MSDSIPSALLPLLADPDTGDPLSLRDGALVAESSGRTFAIEDGVCHLYPHTFDRARMAEERDLARMMRRDRTSARARLSAAEWGTPVSCLRSWGKEKEAHIAHIRRRVSAA